MSESTPEPTPPPHRGRPRMPFAIRVVGGFVVVAIVVGIGLLAREIGDDELVLPDRLAGLDADDVAERGDRAGDLESFYDTNDERLSEAYDGAEAATRQYGGLTGADSPLLVTAVRDESSAPLPVFFDAGALDADAPHNELVEEDDVTCLVSRDDPRETAPTSILCQRTGGDLTVRVYASGKPDVDDIVGATNDVWEELS